ncbi:MAG: hypothetical protein CUR32_04990 [Flavobacterium sp.]|nr:MAG: hypothetical protein CUR32_04990 [Flavobacterium sp.] [Flavobacterium sp. FEMGT703F]
MKLEITKKRNENMQIIFLLIGIFGLIMFYYGFTIFLKKYKCKTPIAELDFNENSNEIYFNQIGLYSISFIGGNYANNIGNLDVRITKDKEDVEIFEKVMKSSFLYKNNIGTEFYQFKIENPGIYKMQFSNINDLELKQSKLASKRLFQNNLPIENVGVLVKEAITNFKYISSILLMVFGFNIAGWGMILAFNPSIFH